MAVPVDLGRAAGCSAVASGRGSAPVPGDRARSSERLGLGVTGSLTGGGAGSGFENANGLTAVLRGVGAGGGGGGTDSTGRRMAGGGGGIEGAGIAGGIGC